MDLTLMKRSLVHTNEAGGFDIEVFDRFGQPRRERGGISVLPVVL